MFSTKSNPDYLYADLHQITLYNLKTRRWQIFKKWLIRLSLLIIIILAAIFYGRYSLYLEQKTKRNNEIAIWLEQCEVFHSSEAIKPAIACYKEVLKRDRHHPVASQNLKRLENQYFQDQNRLLAEMQVSENLDNEPLIPLFVQVDENEQAPDKLEEMSPIPELAVTTVPFSAENKRDETKPTTPVSNTDDNPISESIEQPYQDNDLPTSLSVQFEKTEQAFDKPEERPVVAKSVVAIAPLNFENQIEETESISTASKTDDKPIPETIEGLNQDNEPPSSLSVQVQKTEHTLDNQKERPIVPEYDVATAPKKDETETDETDHATTVPIPVDKPIPESLELATTTSMIADKSIPETIEGPYQDNEPDTEAVVLPESGPPDNADALFLPAIPTTGLQAPENKPTEQTQFVQRPSEKLPRERPLSVQVIEKRIAGLDKLETKPVNEKTELGPEQVENKPANPLKADTILSKKEHKNSHLVQLSDQISLEKQPLSLPASGNREKGPENVVSVVSDNSELIPSKPLISKTSEENQDNQSEKSSALDMLLTIAASIHNESKKATQVEKQVEKPLEAELPADLKKRRESQPAFAKSVAKQPIKKATRPQTRGIKGLLQKCEGHFQANRLTTGTQGTAFKCYHQILALDADNVEAKLGLLKIEGRYESWAEQALRKGKRYSAKQYIQRLQNVNPHSAALPKLQQDLSRLKQQRQKVSQQPLKRRIKTSMLPSKPRIKTSQQLPNKAQRQKAIYPRIKTSQQLPNKAQRQKAIYQAAKPPSPLNLQCGDILAQESLGIRPLTQEQKAFQRESCD